MQSWFRHAGAATLLVLAAVCAVKAQDAPPMSFFVTSVGLDGGSAKLGGLAGADAHCAALARSAGADEWTWRAYLSTADQASQAGVNARDRIGGGPWFNAKGVLIARDLDDLHSDGNAIDRHTALDERGRAIAGRQHDVLTGSDAQGRLAFVYGEPATCGNWRSNGDGHAMMGHHDRFLGRTARFPHWRRSWVASHPSRGCDAERVAGTGSAGLFYCFAADVGVGSTPLTRGAETRAVVASATSLARTATTFRTGLNVAHWLSHNYLPDSGYAAPWFDEEDVRWIAAHGFDHIRLRIAGDRLIDANGDVDAKAAAPIDDALLWARQHGLGVVLTMFSLPGYHHGVIGEPPPKDKSSPFTDEDTLYDAEYVWWQLARRYADRGAELRFELLHRPGAPDKDAMRRFNETLLRGIRAVSPQRVVYLTSRDMDMKSLAEVMESEVVQADWNVALAFEDHGMGAFTAQYDAGRPLVRFPGEVPDMGDVVAAGDPIRKDFGRRLTVAEIDANFATFAESAKRFAWGREIYLAEFGVFERADDASATNYIVALRDAARRHGFSWAVYDYQSGCAVRGEDGSPTRILRALRRQMAD